MSYWYLARSDELLLDLDEYMRPTKSGGAWGEVFFRRRLRDAMLSSKLGVERVFLARSSSASHFHAIVKLVRPMPEIQRLIWQLHLGSDLYRGRADLMRAAKLQKWPSLLIRSTRIPGFYRAPDDECSCQSKHITGETSCSTFKFYRGLSPWDLFGKSEQRREAAVRLPLGEVPLEKILLERTDKK